VARVGARFRGKKKRRFGWSNSCTITRAEPGRALEFEVGKGETMWRYELEPRSRDTCEVTESFEITKPPGTLGRSMTRLGTGVRWSQREADLVGGMRQTLQRLKATAEST
jgi:hypothetical protein